MSDLLLIIVQAAILAYTLVGGVFLAFSDFIMRSLARTSGSGGIEAMQAVNREVFRWVFMFLFLALAPISAGFAIYGFTVIGGSTGSAIAASGLTYFLGCFMVTVVRNVPLNEKLAKMDASSPGASAFWRETYLPHWTFWNSVRGLACVVAAALLLMALPGLYPYS